MKQYFLSIFSLFLFIFTLNADINFDTTKDITIDYTYKYISDNNLLLILNFSINGNVHIQKNDMFFFKINNNNFKILKTILPKPDIWDNNPVFKNKFSVKLKILTTEMGAGKNYTLPLEINYQCCNEDTGVCYFPTQRKLAVKVNQSRQAVPDISSISKKFTFALNNNLLLAFLLVFLGGFLTSLTPCVYPIIPITIGYIGSKSKNSKWKGFILSLFFVLGLSITYSLLGIIAAKTGAVFGSLMQTPPVLGIIAAIFIIMAISMFGAFDIQLPSSIAGKLQSSSNKKGILGAILIGMITGLIAAPCVGPIIISLLAWIAKTGSIFLGFWLLFIFAWGMGILFIIIGTFAGILNTLPKSGKWMEIIKYFFGLLLLITGFYYLKSILNINFYFILEGITLIILGFFIYSSENTEKWKIKLSSALKYILIVFGTFYILFGLIKIHSKNLLFMPKKEVSYQNFKYDFLNNDNAAFAQARKKNKYLFIDFYADWCAECRELEKKTYNTDEVRKKLNSFIKLKMDLTKKNNWTKNKTEQYKISGLPTVIFYSSDGKEIKRFFGFKTKKEFLEILNSLQGE